LRVLRRLGAVAAALALGSAAGHDQIPAPPQSHAVLLRGGDLYTVSHGVKRRTDLLFAEGTIREIGTALAAPAGATVIDVAGQRVYPGLIAPETTLGLIEVGAVRATNDRTEVGAITPEVAAHVAYNPDSELIPTVRTHGITTVQVVPTGSLVRGRSFLTHLDGWTKEDSAVRLLNGVHLTWPSEALGAAWKVKESLEEQRKRITEQRRRLRQTFEQARAYHLARHTGSDLDLDLRSEALRPLFTGEQTLFVSADDYRDIREALEFAAQFELRMVLVGGQDAHRLTGLLLERQVPVIVGTASTLPLREDDDYDIVYRLPALLHRAGVPFCIAHVNAGAWDTRNLPFQAGLAVAFGLSEDAALRALTLSTAEILGVAESLGSLEPGKEATLFVSRGDVMDMLGQQVTHLFIRGRSVDLDDRHKELYRKYLRKPSPTAEPRP
jgi:imidazolonepropionase-like amidohydrolase